VIRVHDRALAHGSCAAVIHTKVLVFTYLIGCVLFCHDGTMVQSQRARPVPKRRTEPFVALRRGGGDEMR
jgi:hypothetical protein